MRPDGTTGSPSALALYEAQLANDARGGLTEPATWRSIGRALLVEALRLPFGVGDSLERRIKLTDRADDCDARARKVEARRKAGQ